MSDKVSDVPVILVVDDSKVIRKAAKKMLGDGYSVLDAVDGADAWEQIQENKAISVVFTDLAMPNMDGHELLDNIRSSDEEHIASLPVIIMTGHSDSDSVKQGVFDKGATDFIAKPFESIDLLTRAKSYAKLSRKVAVLEKQAGRDKLTGLCNASNFEESGNKALSFAQRHKLKLTTAFFEIDGFQETYLKHGKNIAQQILINVGKRVQKSMRSEDVAARIGVARFAMLLPMTSQINALIVINRVRESINKLVFDTGTEKIRVVLSTGYSDYKQDSDIDFVQMMEQVDDALSRAMKKGSGDKVVGFIEEPKEKTTDTISKQQLHDAIDSIMEGDYYQIDESIRHQLVEKIKPFVAYVINPNPSK